MRSFALTQIFLLFFLTAGAQRTISGVVKSATDGLPLIGVTIQVKGSSTGTVTEVDGSYLVEASSDNAQLVFSYTGFRTLDIQVSGRNRIDILMEENIQELEEVVVVGYGVQKKSVITGAISKVKSQDLENMPVVRLEQSLQGRTSGVRVTSSSGQPGAGATVRIRGTTTIGDSNPLYIVDGIPIEGGIDYLNQNDIASIEVLKDAASAAIYGARAANGVVMVTTKQGREGTMEVNYSGYYGLQNPWRKLTLLNAREYAILMNEASAAAGQGILYPNPDALGEGTDWQDAVFNYDAPIQNHEVSLSAGSARSSYYASFGYFDQEGIVASAADSRWQRFSVRLNSTHNVFKGVKFGNTVAYTRTLGRGVAENTEWGSPLGRAINLDPITPIIETDPAKLALPRYANNKDLLVRDKNGNAYGISDIITSEILNPVAALEVAWGKGFADKLVSSVFADWEIIPGLTARTNLGTDLAFWGGEGFTPKHYLNAANRADLTSYSRNSARGLLWNWENTLTYARSIGNHQFTLLAGTAAKRAAGNSHSGSIQDIPVSNPEDASLGFATDPASQTYWGYEYENTLSSYFGRLNYNYRSKYLLTALMRVDGSSRFGTNNKYGYFPSVSMGWVLTEERFLQRNDFINFLKLRGSYGVNGNDRIGDFRYVSTVGGGRSYTFGINNDLINGVSPNAIANPDLKWEETSEMNFGIDAKVLRRVSLGIDYYNKKTTGMLLQVEVPAYVGNVGPIGNIAELVNKGYELELGYSNKIGGLQFDFAGNISYVQNEILNLGQEKTFLPGNQRFGPQGIELTRTMIGYAYESFFGYKTNGLFQNQAEVDSYVNADGKKLQPNAKPGDIRFADVNRDGIINENDRTIIGEPTPSWTYGFNASVDYKGFDVVVFGQGVFGNEIYNATRRFDLPKANFTADALGRWTGEGTSTYFPRLNLEDGNPGASNQNLTRSSDFWLQNGSFFRIKTLQFGYTLSSKAAQFAGIKKARFYVSANNLWTLTKYKGFDPEIGAGAGVDKGIYPQPRFYLFGLNVTFGD